jgi:multiple sugar transport system permease protein
MKRSPLHQWIIYLLLIGGTILFTFPFLWMVSSSVKVDRELYTEELKVLPMTPRPVPVSPYIDPTFFIDLPDSATKQAEITRAIEPLARASGYALPAEVIEADAWREVSRGLYKRLKSVLPLDVWNGPTPALVDAAKPHITAESVKNTFEQVYRYLAVGGVRVRDDGVRFYPLGEGKKITELWKVSGPAKTTFTDFNDKGKPAGKLQYDFSAGNSITLIGEFDLPMDPKDLRRIQIDLKPDDTWHNYSLVAEFGGKKLVAERTAPLGNYDWFTATYRPASEDDQSTKLRTWIVLDDKGASEFTTPGKMRLTLTFDRVTQSTAWANKVKANYIRTAEQIPFWRYVRVSLFLVLANIVLTVLSSSLVAYAFSRITWPGRDICFLLMLATMMIPSQVTMIPHFLIWTNLGAYNTLSPLWMGAAFGSAFFVFMLRQFMMGIPRDLEDAARIDGCGFLRIYWHVILPLITPSLAAIAVMTFMGTWNDFMSPLIYIADQRLYPLAFGLYAFNIQVQSNPALAMAGSVLMTVPVIVLFFSLQRYFIQGITLTGMKG